VDASLERLGLVVVAAALGCAAGYAVGRLAQVTAEPPTDPGRNPRLAAAGRLGIAASGMNSDRYRCGGCEMVTTAGPLTGHQRVTGHEGRFKV